MKLITAISLAVFMIAASPSYAGLSELRACGAKLSPEAQLILRAVVPKMKPGVNARRVLKSTVVDLIKSGEIARTGARTKARAAGGCLKKLKD